MFIEVTQKLKCSKCGSRLFENFHDSQYRGVRCLECGHESKQRHPHLQESSGGSASWVARDEDVEF